MTSKTKIGTTLAGLALTAVVGGWGLNTLATAFNKAANASTDRQVCSFNILLPTNTADAKWMQDNKAEVSGLLAETDTQQPPMESGLVATMIHDSVAAGKTVTIKKIDDNCLRLSIR